MKTQLTGAMLNVRLEYGMRKAIMDELVKRNSNPLCCEWTVSEWVRQAIADKLAHCQRSRRGRKRSQAAKETPPVLGGCDERGCEEDCGWSGID